MFVEVQRPGGLWVRQQILIERVKSFVSNLCEDFSANRKIKLLESEEYQALIPMVQSLN
jgi:hypothetical protein